jgi:dolichyldiphosphatase
MPSSHAQFMAFFSVSLTLFLLIRHRPPPTATSWPAIPVLSSLPYPSRRVQCFLVSIAALVLAGAVAISRTYLNYHTQYQVLVGCLAGVCSAILWFAFVSLARYQGVLDLVLDLEISRWLRLRDLLVDEDIVESGWKEWERRRKSRRLPKSRKKA